MCWTCTANPNPIWIGSTLTWEISASNNGCTPTFAHEGLTADGPPYEMTAQGWQHFMASLQSYVEGGAGQPW